MLISPSYRQGACQAIEDAAVLGNLLQHNRASLSNAAPILADYSKQRKQRVRDLVTFSSSFAALHMAKLPYGSGPLLRRLIYTFVPGWGWLWYLRWLYGVQPIIENMDASNSFKKEI
jgi:salicylate hydroxylase